MSFEKHPSQKLNVLFNKRPYQGQDPAKARIIFLSSDANYSNEISNHAFFDRILEYHDDGVLFWKTHEKHHPFLLPEYPFDRRKGGVVFHRNFGALRLSADHAADISFLELLDVPTLGMKSENKKKFFDLISKSHIDYIDRLIQSGQRKLVLIPGGVLRDMREIKKRFAVFQWLDSFKVGAKFEKIVGNSEVKEIYHFSASQFHGSIPIVTGYIGRWLRDSKS